MLQNKYNYIHTFLLHDKYEGKWITIEIKNPRIITILFKCHLIQQDNPIKHPFHNLFNLITSVQHVLKRPPALPDSYITTILFPY